MPKPSPIVLQSLTNAAATLCLVGLVGYGATAEAATLFIDLNNAPAEIAAVQAARPAGEVLISTPSERLLPRQDRDKVYAIQQAYDQVHKRGLDCARLGNCQQIWSELRRLELERQSLVRRIDPRSLALDIQHELKQRPVNIERVIISGHHAEGYFRGEIAELDVDAMMYLDLALPQVFRRVSSVYLLGCATGTAENFRDRYSALFPAARLIVGAEDNAPTRNEPRNLAFIRSVLALEQDLLTTRGLVDTRALYRRLLRQPWPVSLFWQQRYYYSREYPSGIALN